MVEGISCCQCLGDGKLVVEEHATLPAQLVVAVLLALMLAWLLLGLWTCGGWLLHGE